MRILIAGGDGFCGWATALHFSAAGHEVTVLDNFVRRRWDEELGTEPLEPIASLSDRVDAWRELTGNQLSVEILDMVDHERLLDAIRRHAPEAVVHFAEQSSAPYSMMDAQHAVATQLNNVVGTLNLLFAIRDEVPECHLVKLGTMGEYGTPNIDIEEGYLEVVHNGRCDVLPYPKQPGSFYHLSKVHDSANILFACRAWGLRATDLNQGVVYNTRTEHTAIDPRLANRYDYDSVFGTALNRFCVQAALEGPITVYGQGGQTRGFIDLRDTVRCVELAVQKPASPGELRVLNQFTEQFSVLELAQRVERVARAAGLDSRLVHLDNPRVEAERHYYNAKHHALLELGLEPHLLGDETVATMLTLARTHVERVRTDTMTPTISWRRGRAVPAAAVNGNGNGAGSHARLQALELSS